MFVFTFDRGLFRFTLNTPALEVLFQLPPRIGSSIDSSPIVSNIYLLTAFIQPPNMRPISLSILFQFSYCLSPKYLNFGSAAILI